jgi:hypothetical protein
VCIDCQYPRLAVRAIELSLAECSYERVKLLTDDPRAVPARDPRIEVVPISPIRSIEDYSRFVVKELLHHVSTDFVQVIQWDGYVINGKAWSDSFLQYDYIGARWWFREDGRNVGNGGFSLRSRRLLEALQDPEILVNDAEDNVICVIYRSLLEQRHGIRFAPGEVADRYAFEGITPTLTEFGFHRVFNFAYLYDAATLATVVDGIPDEAFRPEAMVTFIEILGILKRTPEALRYAQRFRQDEQRFARLPADFRARFETITAGLDADATTHLHAKK